jgi:hypothetical protein
MGPRDAVTLRQRISAAARVRDVRVNPERPN